MVLARTKSSKIKGLVEHELSKRQANRATYEQDLSIKGKSREEASSISDYLFEHKKSWNEAKKEQILQKYPTVKTFYDFLVPDTIRERDFWERYGYRCDEGRIRKYFESLTPKQVEQQVEQITERKEEEKGRVYQLPKGKAMSVQLLNQLSPRSKKNQSTSDKATPSYDRSKLRKSVTSIMVASALQSSIEKEKEEEPSPAPFSRSMLRSTKEGQALVGNDEDEQPPSLDQETDEGEKDENTSSDEAGNGEMPTSSAPVEETTALDNAVSENKPQKEEESEATPTESIKESSGVSSEGAVSLDTAAETVDAQMDDDTTPPTQSSEEAGDAVTLPTKSTEEATKAGNEETVEATESYSRQFSNLMKAKKLSSGDLASADKPPEIVDGDGNVGGVPTPQPVEAVLEATPDDSEPDSKLPVDEPEPETAVDQEQNNIQPASVPVVEPTTVDQEANDVPPTSEPTAVEQLGTAEDELVVEETKQESENAEEIDIHAASEPITAEAVVEPTVVDQEANDVPPTSGPTAVEQPSTAEDEPVVEETKQELETAEEIEELGDSDVPETDVNPDELEELVATSAPSQTDLQHSFQEDNKPNLSVSTEEVPGEEHVEPESDDFVAPTDELETSKEQPDILTRVTEAVFSPRTLKEARRLDQSDIKVLLQKKLNELGIVPVAEVPEKSTLKEESEGPIEPNPGGTEDIATTESEQSGAAVVHEITETVAPETIEHVEALDEINPVGEKIDSPQQLPGGKDEVSQNEMAEPLNEVSVPTESLPREAPVGVDDPSDMQEERADVAEAAPETESFVDTVVPEGTNEAVSDDIVAMEEDSPTKSEDITAQSSQDVVQESMQEDSNDNTLEVANATTESNDAVDTDKEEKEAMNPPGVEKAEPNDETSLSGELAVIESAQPGKDVGATTEGLAGASTHSQPYDERKQKPESGGSGIWGMFRASMTKPAAKPRQLSLEEEKAKQLALLQEQMGNMADIAESMDAQSKIVAGQPKVADLASDSSHEVNNRSASKGWNVMGIFGDSHRSLNNEPVEQATEGNITAEDPSDDTKGIPVEQEQETNAISDPELEPEPAPEPAPEPESQSENTPELSQEAEPTVEPQPESAPESVPVPAASQKEAGFMGLGSWFGGGKGHPKKEDIAKEKSVETGAVEAKATAEPAEEANHNKGFGVLSMFGVGEKEADKESAIVPGAEEPTEETAIEEPKAEEEELPSSGVETDSPEDDETPSNVDEEPTSAPEETVDSEPPVVEQPGQTSSTSPDAPISQETENTGESMGSAQSEVIVPQESTEISTAAVSATVGTPNAGRPKLSAEERAAKRLRIKGRMNALDELCRTYRSAYINGGASKAPAIASN